MACIRLNRLHHRTTDADIVAFLDPCQIEDILKPPAIGHIAERYGPGVNPGWCLVLLASRRDLALALAKDKHRMQLGDKFSDVSVASSSQYDYNQLRRSLDEAREAPNKESREKILSRCFETLVTSREIQEDARLARARQAEAQAKLAQAEAEQKAREAERALEEEKKRAEEIRNRRVTEIAEWDRQMTKLVQRAKDARSNPEHNARKAENSDRKRAREEKEPESLPKRAKGSPVRQEPSVRQHAECTREKKDSYPSRRGDNMRETDDRRKLDHERHRRERSPRFENERYQRERWSAFAWHGPRGSPRYPPLFHPPYPYPPFFPQRPLVPYPSWPVVPRQRRDSPPRDRRRTRSPERASRRQRVRDSPVRAAVDKRVRSPSARSRASTKSRSRSRASSVSGSGSERPRTVGGSKDTSQSSSLASSRSPSRSSRSSSSRPASMTADTDAIAVQA